MTAISLITAAAIAASGVAAGAQDAAPRDAARATSRARQVRGVGFQPLAEVARVFVRTSAPGRYTISDGGERTIVVRLDAARPRGSNDLRPLDTSYFTSPVLRIEPRREGSAYVVAITLRDRVDYRQKVEGDVLALDFEYAGGARPASGAPTDPTTTTQDAPVSPPAGAGLVAPAPPAPAEDGVLVPPVPVAPVMR